MPILKSYIDRNLMADEHVICKAKQHWRAFFSSWIIDYLLGASEYAVTNKRIFTKTGIISKNNVEINLNKVESVKVEMSILGRILGYGDIIVTGSGGTKEKFEFVASPENFRKTFQDAIANS